MKPHKTCSKCNKSKPRNAFAKDKQKLDGLAYVCKTCKRAYLKNRYENNKEDILTSPVRRYHNAKANAALREKEFNLSFEFYVAILQKGCYYCDVSILKDQGMGMDRVDNDKGYIATNVLPCCTPCNYGRHLNFTVDEWRAGAQAIKDFRNRNKK